MMMDNPMPATVAPPPADDLGMAIGNTPLIKLRRASAATGCTILGKAEFMNPGGSVKDRAALAIILDAERRGVLKPGGTVVEGTAGNTGIGLTLVGNACGYKTVIVMPETQSKEKIDFLRMIGADLRLIPAKPYRDPGNYVHFSRRLAEEMGAVWSGQFDNLADPGSVVSYIDLAALKRMRDEGKIVDGMLPKAKAIEDAIRGGVRRVHVISYSAPDSILTEVFTNEGTGTLIVADTKALTPAEQQPGS